jgi:hypothetical protein
MTLAPQERCQLFMRRAPYSLERGIDLQEGDAEGLVELGEEL